MRAKRSSVARRTVALRVVVNALSIDVEEYYHALIFQESTRPAPRRFPSRVQASVERILDLFEDAGARATFFTLGEVAAEQPKLVRAIAEAGHEVACHGYRHVPVSDQPVDVFVRTCIARSSCWKR